MKTHNDHIGKQVRDHGYYELTMLNFIKENVGRGTYVDCGANIGNHSVFFAKECSCSVVAFEPDIENYRLLLANTAGINVETWNVGLGDEDVEMGIKRFPHNMGMNKLISGTGVSVKKLDNFSLDDVKLIKIDVEGMEREVLIGGMRLVSRFKPVLLIETNDPDSILALLPSGYKKKRKFNWTATWLFEV